MAVVLRLFWPKFTISPIPSLKKGELDLNDLGTASVLTPNKDQAQLKNVSRSDDHLM